jgi:hypothetical protein
MCHNCPRLDEDNAYCTCLNEPIEDVTDEECSKGDMYDTSNDATC